MIFEAPLPPVDPKLIAIAVIGVWLILLFNWVIERLQS